MPDTETTVLQNDIIVDPPPILPDIEDELRKYLICPERLPIHSYERNQEFWPRVPDPIELLYFEESPLSTTLKVSVSLA